MKVINPVRVTAGCQKLNSVQAAPRTKGLPWHNVSVPHHHRGGDWQKKSRSQYLQAGMVEIWGCMSPTEALIKQTFLAQSEIKYRWQVETALISYGISNCNKKKVSLIILFIHFFKIDMRTACSRLHLALALMPKTLTRLFSSTNRLEIKLNL